MSTQLTFHSRQISIRQVSGERFELVIPLTVQIDPGQVEEVLHPGESQLTNRQMEILIMYARGFSTKEMAEQLFISVKTVETHMRDAAIKLGARNSRHMIYLAYRKGIIKVEDDDPANH